PRIEKVWRHCRSTDDLDEVFTPSFDIESFDKHDIGEEIGLGLQNLQYASRYATEPGFVFVSMRALTNFEKSFRLSCRNWIQEHSVHHAINRRRRPNTQRERQHRDSGEPWVLSKHPRAEAEILPC